MADGRGDRCHKVEKRLKKACYRKCWLINAGPGSITESGNSSTETATDDDSGSDR